MIIASPSIPFLRSTVSAGKNHTPDPCRILKHGIPLRILLRRDSEGEPATAVGDQYPVRDQRRKGKHHRYAGKTRNRTSSAADGSGCTIGRLASGFFILSGRSFLWISIFEYIKWTKRTVI